MSNQNIEKKRAWETEYRKKYPEKVNAIKLKHYYKKRDEYLKKNKIRYRNRHLHQRYKTNVDALSKIYIEQEGKCAISGHEFKNRKEVHIDHDHNTGKIRGLLISRCNTGIGLFHDNICELYNAIIYLQKDQLSDYEI